MKTVLFPSSPFRPVNRSPEAADPAGLLRNTADSVMMEKSRTDGPEEALQPETVPV